jgi:hypothetical protein
VSDPLNVQRDVAKAIGQVRATLPNKLANSWKGDDIGIIVNAEFRGASLDLAHMRLGNTLAASQTIQEPRDASITCLGDRGQNQRNL